MTDEEKRVKFLIDVNCDYLADSMKKMFRGNCKVVRAKVLDQENKNMHSDYSLLKYAEQNGMVVVTMDQEMIEGCEENQIRCVKPLKLSTYRSLDTIETDIIYQLQLQGLQPTYGVYP
nr:hypothetical protein [uncultured Nitrososphaera sp.]